MNMQKLEIKHSILPRENIKWKDKYKRENRSPGKPSQEELFGCCQIL